LRFKVSKSLEAFTVSSLKHSFLKADDICKTEPETDEYVSVVDNLLNNLQKYPENKSYIISLFEDNFKYSQWPILSTHEISTLFYGKAESSNGLIDNINCFKGNIIGAEACLLLTGKLLNYEFNPECDKYRDILTECKNKDIDIKGLKHFKDSYKFEVSQIAITIMNILEIEQSSTSSSSEEVGDSEN